MKSKSPIQWNAVSPDVRDVFITKIYPSGFIQVWTYDQKINLGSFKTDAMDTVAYIMQNVAQGLVPCSDCGIWVPSVNTYYTYPVCDNCWFEIY